MLHNFNQYLYFIDHFKKPKPPRNRRKPISRAKVSPNNAPPISENAPPNENTTSPCDHLRSNSVKSRLSESDVSKRDSSTNYGSNRNSRDILNFRLNAHTQHDSCEN